MKEYALVLKRNGDYRYVGELVYSRRVVVRDRATGRCWLAYEYEPPLPLPVRFIAGFSRETVCGRPDYELDIGGDASVNENIFVVDSRGNTARLRYYGYYMAVTGRRGVVEGLLYIAELRGGGFVGVVALI